MMNVLNSLNKSGLQNIINLIWRIKNHYPIPFYLFLIICCVTFLIIIAAVRNLFKKSNQADVKVNTTPIQTKLSTNKPSRPQSEIPKEEIEKNGNSVLVETVTIVEETSKKKEPDKTIVIKKNSEPTQQQINTITPSTKVSGPIQKKQDKSTVELTNMKEANQSVPISPSTVSASSIQEPALTIIKLKPESVEKTPKIIGYTPNNHFKQKEPYKYGVVKMPKPSSYVKFARKGRSNKRGFTESEFLDHLNFFFGKDFQVSDDKHIPKVSKKPYEPDFILINEKIDKNIYIVIEIDEPYDGYRRTPTHCLADDDDRDEFLTNRGWILIKFAEIQIHKEPINCCALIAKVIYSIDSTYKNDLVFYQLSTLTSQWDSLCAKKWAAENYREKYLGINSFGKVPDVIIDYDYLESESDKIVEASVPKSKMRRLKQNGTLAKQNKISRDSRLLFDSINHKYFIDNDPLTLSVTQLIDKFFPEFDAPYWAPIKAKQRGITTEAMLDEWKEKGLSSSAKGTALHEAIENFYNDKPHDSETVEFKYFLDYKTKYSSFTPFRTEWRVFDEDIMIAGTIDIVYKNDNGELLIFDWKRSKKVLMPDGSVDNKYYKNAFGGLSHLGDNSFNRYCLQQNIYKYILEKKYQQRINSMNLLILHEEYDSAKLVKVPEMRTEVEYIFEYARLIK